MTGEARGYSWPAFEEGNDAAMKHGARSEAKLRPLVGQLIESLHAVAPWTSAVVFRPTVEAWAWVEAQAVLYRNWFDERGVGEASDELPPSLGRWDKAEARAASLRSELGLSPASLTRLLSGLSSIDGPAAMSGLDALREAGAALRTASAQPALGAGPEPSAEELEQPSGEVDGCSGGEVEGHLTSCADRPAGGGS